MIDAPLVSIVMPVRLTSEEYDEYLGKAVESVLNQTYRNFELIIIDGSPPEKEEKVASYQRLDERIRVLREDRPGYANARNMGCRVARGKYIAILDSDDVSAPTRIQEQVMFLEKHQDIGILGTWVKVIDNNDRTISILRSPTSCGMIAWSLIFGNCMANSSVMMRRNVLEKLGFYRQTAQFEDYDLWARASFVTRIANLSQPLLYLRKTSSSLSSRTASTADQGNIEVMHYFATRLIPDESSVQRSAILYKVLRFMPSSIDQINQAMDYIALLEHAFFMRHEFPDEDKNAITKNLERKIVLLSILAARQSIRGAIETFVRGAKTFPQTFKKPVPLLSREFAYDLLNLDIKLWGTRVPFRRKAVNFY